MRQRIQKTPQEIPEENKSSSKAKEKKRGGAHHARVPGLGKCAEVHFSSQFNYKCDFKRKDIKERKLSEGVIKFCPTDFLRFYLLKCA